MRGAQQGGHGLQETHCDAWHLGVPLANTSQLLAQGLLQGQGEGAWTGALPPWVGAQWEDLKAEGVGSAEALYPWAPKYTTSQVQPTWAHLHDEGTWGLCWKSGKGP